MNYRKGDVVSVQGVVEYDQTDNDKMVFIKIPGAVHSVAMTPQECTKANLTMVQPMFEVGESVRWEGHGIGIIHAIKDGHAWIGMASGDYCTRLLTSINRDETPEA